MYSVYQHWDPLKVCVVGKSYPPEFYSWIKNPKTRSIFEKIAIETEEDFQALIKTLESFDVDVLRLSISDKHADSYREHSHAFEPPPMCPRDIGGVYGSDLILDSSSIATVYNHCKVDSWPEVNDYRDLKNLPKYIYDELSRHHTKDYPISMYDDIMHLVGNNCNIKHTSLPLSTASTTRIGKDIYIGDMPVNKSVRNVADDIKLYFDDKYRLHFLDIVGHTDAYFCPVVPGLIISLEDIPTYKDTFPGWEVVYLPCQSWSKIKPFLDLKQKNLGKWWIPGEEYNDDVIETVDTWLRKWVGYVEETVFDVNMLVVNEKNVIVSNYNKSVFDALERHKVTPHICNFRHRYFWDGGLHCITLDIDREGEMKDYFPGRG